MLRSSLRLSLFKGRRGGLRTPLNIEYGAPCPPPRHAMGLCKRNFLFLALTTCRSFLHDTRLSLSHRFPLPFLFVFSFETDSLSETRTRNWIWVNRSSLASIVNPLSGWMAWLVYITNDFHIFLEIFIFVVNDPPRFFFFFLKIVEMIPIKLSN